ncbi:uncharacterized protein LOC129825649 [Salvelinus fontinalis]|uniref:uncharacterized protein LOC129825649 n=1 Tax=Salvelinus fontinalis TaxID=8038 RepID=UPI002486C028|nr:uncharacterized protein LOC129825649 [Salvelinus fontinalis]
MAGAKTAIIVGSHADRPYGGGVVVGPGCVLGSSLARLYQGTCWASTYSSASACFWVCCSDYSIEDCIKLVVNALLRASIKTTSPFSQTPSATAIVKTTTVSAVSQGTASSKLRVNWCVDYLLRQTEKAMQDMNPDSEETDFEDYAMDPTVGSLLDDFTTTTADFSAAIPTQATTVQPASSSAKSAATSTWPTSPTAQSAASQLPSCKKLDWFDQ